VMKGFNLNQVGRIIKGKWQSFRNPIAIGLDAVKFDMHVSPAMLKWEHNIYRSIYGRRNTTLRKLLEWQMNNRGVGYTDNGKLKYKVKGKRFSGDMNTALGNCLIMCCMIYEYAHILGISVKLVNNGDDCVVFMEREYEERFRSGVPDFFLKLGFRMTVEPTVDVLEGIEFCQMHPIQVGPECRMVRNISTALEKDTMVIPNVSAPKTLKAWMGAVGDGGVVATSGIPIMQSFYRCYQRISGGVRNKIGTSTEMSGRGMDFMVKDMQCGDGVILSETRLSVYLAWGITPDEQIVLEEFFDNYDHCFDAPLDYNLIPNHSTTINELCLSR
jgi:hypothetical protein